jgi:hypothetical protein
LLTVVSCSHCHEFVEPSEGACPKCGHDLLSPRMLCTCAKCRPDLHGRVTPSARARQAAEVLPSQIREAIDRYSVHGYRTGDFLYAFLSNDLSEAVGRADPANVRLLAEIRDYVLEFVPDSAWGSKEKVEAWLDAHSVRRARARLLAENGGAA